MVIIGDTFYFKLNIRSYLVGILGLAMDLFLHVLILYYIGPISHGWSVAYVLENKTSKPVLPPRAGNS